MRQRHTHTHNKPSQPYPSNHNSPQARTLPLTYSSLYLWSAQKWHAGTGLCRL